MNRIKYYRQKNNMTQKQLGNLIGKSQIAIHQYENSYRMPSIATAMKLAKALGTSVDSLFSFNI